MSVRRQTANRLTLFRTCGTCGKRHGCAAWHTPDRPPPTAPTPGASAS